jgi:hypothetical protein
LHFFYQLARPSRYWSFPCQPFCGGRDFFRSVGPFINACTALPISWPIHQACALLSYLSARPSMETCAAFRSVDPFVGASQLGTLSAYPSGLYCATLFVASGPSVDDSFCALYQSAPPWRLCTTPSISQPLRERFLYTFYPSAPRRDFLLHFLSVETLRFYAALYWSAPPLRLYILSVGPSAVAYAALSISQPLAVEALYCSLYQSALPRRLCTLLYTSRPLRGGFVLYFPFYQSAPPWRLCTALSISRPLRGGFVLYFIPVGPSVEALHCTLYQSAPPWRLCTVLYTSQPLRGGFVLRSLSVGPSVEALYCTSYQPAPPWRLYTTLSISWPLRGCFILHLLSVSLSVEALYCTLYQSALLWRLCTVRYTSRSLRGGFVLHFLN